MAKRKQSKSDIRCRILEAALPDVAFDGWSDELVAKAAGRIGLSEEEAQEAFPKGALDLVQYFSQWADEQAFETLTPAKMRDLKVREKIALGVRTRLTLVARHKPAISSALAFMALPPRNIFLPKMVWKTADTLWRAAGDTSTDYNHYTKRLLLSGVLTSTTLYWLNDKSDDNENTWTFLDRRIEEVLKVGQKIASFKKRREA